MKSLLKPLRKKIWKTCLAIKMIYIKIRSKIFPPPPKGKFINVNKALKYPPGLLSIGGEITPETVTEAFNKGIITYSYDKSIKWWSPNPRMVLLPTGLIVQQGLRRVVKQNKYKVTFDTAFKEVLLGCANREITWITDKIIDVYCELHERGIAHSVETWNKDGELVGGCFGFVIGNSFSTQSLFHYENNTSKVAFMYLNCYLQHWGYEFNDLHYETDNWKSQGCLSMSRKEYTKMLEKASLKERSPGQWKVDENLNVANWDPKIPGSQLCMNSVSETTLFI